MISKLKIMAMKELAAAVVKMAVYDFKAGNGRTKGRILEWIEEDELYFEILEIDKKYFIQKLLDLIGGKNEIQQQ